MQPVKILHCADFHLGASLYGMEHSSVLRSRDLTQAFLDTITLCKSEHIQLLLIAGDLFENWNLSPDIFLMAKQQFESIPDTLVAIAPGNHDPYSPESCYTKREFWPGNVLIFPDRWTSQRLDSLGVELWGAGFGAPYQSKSLLQPVTPRRPEFLQIGVLHATIAAASDYHPITLAEIGASGLDYLALGHIHKPSAMEREGNTTYAYPGCPQGRSFGEQGPRGVLMGTVAKHSCMLDFVPMGKKMYLQTKLDITGAVGASAVAELIEQHLNTQYGEDYLRHLYRISLTGKVSDMELSLDSIKNLLAHLCFLQLQDHTELDCDLAELAGELSLRGRFVTQMLARLEAEDSDTVRLALKLGLKSFAGEVPYYED